MKPIHIVFILIGLTLIQGARFNQVQQLMKQSIFATNLTGQPNANQQAKPVNNPENPTVLKEGWLRLASQEFQDPEKYPNLPLGNNKHSKVEVLIGQITNRNTIVSTGTSRNEPQVFFRINKNYGKNKEIPSLDSFYFRISGTNAYYTETKTDMVVQGAIQITNIASTKQSFVDVEKCFTIENSESDKWTLCASSLNETKAWTCSIKQAMGQSCDSELVIKPQEVSVKEVTVKKQNIILIPQASPFCNEKWNYQQKGKDWTCTCQEGKLQSPIKFDGFKKTLDNSAEFQFKKVDIQSINLEYKENMMRMITADQQGFATLVDYELNEYQAKEILFHTPAEHQISQKQAAMELQVVFEPIGTTSVREKAILSFIINQKAGATNYFLDFLDPLDLPNQISTTKRLRTQNDYSLKPQSNNIQKISLLDLFKENENDQGLDVFNYYYYQGSLTAPPCQESVRWFVVDEEVNFSYSSIEMIKHVLEPPTQGEVMEISSNVIPSTENVNSNGNNRETQPLNNRQIYYYDKTQDKCHDHKKFEKKKDTLNGHYEKIETKVFNYYYVPGTQPSGLPNSKTVQGEEVFGIDEIQQKLQRVTTPKIQN